MTFRTIEPTASAYAYPLLIKHLIKTPLRYAPQQEILYRDRVRHDYRTLEERIHRLAGALRGLGIGPGDTVAVMDWDSHRYLECFFAVPMMGAVLHTINIRLSPEQLAYTINHAEDDVILVFSDFLPLLEGIRDEIRTVERFVLLQDDPLPADTTIPIAGEYEELLAQAPPTYDFPDFDENTMATTFYTTGTTGMPKGVFFSHRQIVLHTFGLMSGLCAFHSQIQVDSATVYMPLTPMFHVHAWGMPYFFTLLGTRQVYPGRYEPDTILRLVAREKVTFSHCVPTILHMVITSPEARAADLSGWQVVIGGSALPKGLCKAALDMGISLTTAYGMSETCPVLTVANMKPPMLGWDEADQIEVRCKTGLPVPLVDLEVVDFDGSPCPRDGQTPGEVVVRSPWLTQGYVKDEERSEALWQDGWLHTGDIGVVDPEGYLKITDRLKDVIKTGGEWISSLALEDIVSQHESVSEAAVIGVPDDKWGERPLALVVLKPGITDVTPDDLREHFLRQVEKGVLPKYGVPDRIVITDAIAKTSVGKINKKALRRHYR
jgi:fatty-acyl-CoA synthase